MYGLKVFPTFISSQQEAPNLTYDSYRIRFSPTMALLGIIFISLLSCAVNANASSLQLKIIDKTGEAFPDVLVIVKSLEGKGEIFRALTDAKGIVASREVLPGLYRIIATCPYGICETKVQEFYIKNAPLLLEMSVDVASTHGVGDVVEFGPAKKLKVQILDSENQPARLASLLVRAADAQHEQWYKTNSEGFSTVEIPAGSVTFVVSYGESITSKTLSITNIENLRTKGAPLIIHLE